MTGRKVRYGKRRTAGELFLVGHAQWPLRGERAGPAGGKKRVAYANPSTWLVRPCTVMLSMSERARTTLVRQRSRSARASSVSP